MVAWPGARGQLPTRFYAKEGGPELWGREKSHLCPYSEISEIQENLDIKPSNCGF